MVCCYCYQGIYFGYMSHMEQSLLRICHCFISYTPAYTSLLIMIITYVCIFARLNIVLLVKFYDNFSCYITEA